MSFHQVARYQLVVGRRQHRDELVLKAEIKNGGIDNTKPADDLNEKFQDICRIKIDKIDLVDAGTIPKKQQGIKDERKWE